VLVHPPSREHGHAGPLELPPTIFVLIHSVVVGFVYGRKRPGASLPGWLGEGAGPPPSAGTFV
jgi:hypothetical protein